MNDPKGSLWRKWDLHIHTPASYHWNGGKIFQNMNLEEKEKSINEIISKINNSEIAAFAIMDYWTFDGYCEIKKYIQTNNIICSKTIFPGMEIRVTAPTNFNLNFHFLLSDKLTDQQLSDFKSRLIIRIGKYKKNLSREALIDLGNSYGSDKVRIHGFNPEKKLSDYELWKLGSMTAEITIDSIEEAISVLPEKSVLILLPYDTTDGISKLDWKKYPQSDNLFLKTADIFESRTQSIRNVIQGKETPENIAFFNNFQNAIGKSKPVVSGSDAHKISDYGSYPSNNATWIKADPTWAGLGIVVREPQERCFIGEFPPQLLRVRDNQTKYIKKVTIKKEETSDLREIWFDNEVEFNNGLVAIIGNKGNGKSALVDILGLLCDSNKQDHFSFLNRKQFRQLNNNKAKHFWSELEWESGNKNKKNLNQESETTQLELINYIPQDYFEIICNELEGGQGSCFDKELKSVVFSHIDSSDRLGRTTLDDLLEYKTTEIEQEILLIRRKLHNINQRIINFENQVQPEHREKIDNNLLLKKSELDAIEKTKPKIIKKPSKSKNKSSDNLILQLEKTRGGLTKQIENLEKEQANLSLQISILEKVIAKIELLIRQFDELVEENKKELVEIGIDINKLLEIRFKKEPITVKINELKNKKKSIDDKLDKKKKDNLHSELDKIKTKIKSIQEKLDEPNKKYQKYKEELNDWEIKRSKIIGKSTITNTIKYYESQLKELDSIPKKLKAEKTEREEITRQIHKNLKKITSIYSDSYIPVQNFISSHHLAKDSFNLIFDVSIINSNFPERFFEFIHRGTTGSFYGQIEGEELLNKYIKKYKFLNEDETINFINEINNLLHVVEKTGEEITPQRQLKKGYYVIDLYDYIFSLDYLKPRHLLKLGEKELPELSPGEKGTLLLIFYLLIDKSEIPLIIDQPEHNLDNETIYDLLVPAIKEAKQYRQIIVVTHNPNIAVVCDADQVICASIDKSNKYKVSYLIGSIENPDINNRILEVLEGTKPAFENRDDKYTLCWINE